MTSATKISLRRQMRQRRQALSDAQQRSAAAALLANLRTVEAFIEARTVAMYVARDGEIDPDDAMRWCWKQHKHTYLPRLQRRQKSLCFAPVARATVFTHNRFNIPEPVAGDGEIVTARQLDLVLLPLVAFDDRGNRIGMGGGFYDATFAFIAEDKPPAPRLIGIAHELQRVAQIEVEPWDVPLVAVVTDRGIYRPG